VDHGAPRDVAARRDGDWLAVTVDGVTRRVLTADADGELWVARAGHTWALRERSPLAAARTVAPHEAGPLVAPLPGTVAEVAVAAGEAVQAGQTLMVVEAMKMRHPVTAPRAGRVAAVHAAVGEQVAIQQPLIELAGHATA
jgi:acetyl-CoA/propionyl-CoA carboxylase biotin carboxyl carrier protein